MSNFPAPDYDTWKTTDPNEVDETDYECQTCGYRADECSCMHQDQDWIKVEPPEPAGFGDPE